MIVDVKNILIDLDVRDQKQLIEKLAFHADNFHMAEHEKGSFDVHDIVRAIIEREKLGSTGIGNGVAIPHARLKGLLQFAAIFARLANPIEYDSIDERKVDLVVLLLAPMHKHSEHLRALAKVSRSLAHAENRQQLRMAPNQQAIHALLNRV